MIPVVDVHYFYVLSSIVLHVLSRSLCVGIYTYLFILQRKATCHDETRCRAVIVIDMSLSRRLSWRIGNHFDVILTNRYIYLISERGHFYLSKLSSSRRAAYRLSGNSFSLYTRWNKSGKPVEASSARKWNISMHYWCLSMNEIWMTEEPLSSIIRLSSKEDKKNQPFLPRNVAYKETAANRHIITAHAKATVIDPVRANDE